MARKRSVLLALPVLALCLFAPRPAPRSTCKCQGAAMERGRRDLPAAMRGAFVENLGQWETAARFVARFRNLVARIEDDGVALDLRSQASSKGALVRLAFGSTPGASTLTGEAPRAGERSYFLGSDPTRWRTGVRAYGSVLLQAVRPGIDIRFRQSGGRLEYDLLVAAGASPGDLVVTCEGSERLDVDAAGNLVLDTAAGRLVQTVPATWSVAPSGDRVPLACRFVRVGDRRFSFAVEGRDPSLPLVIDPVLLWGSYVGAKDDEGCVGVGVDGEGHVVVAGSTLSVDFPTTPGAYDRTFGGARNSPWLVGDGFVAKLHRDNGSLLWATYVGGKENDQVNGVAVARASGDAVITGWTTSTDFPTTAGAFDRTFNGVGDGYKFGGGDIYVTRVSGDGKRLVYSTFLGGKDLEYALALDMDPSEAVVVTGHVHSPDFPTTPGAHRRNVLGWSDCFVTKLAPDGSRLLASTLYGGTKGEEYGKAIVAAADGTVYVAGPTDSQDLPTHAGAYDRTYNGGGDHWADGFIARFDASFSKVLLGTYLGTKDNDYVHAMTVEPNGAITVAGQTDSPEYPTTPGAIDRKHNGLWDGFVTRLDAAGSRIEWSTYLGGSAKDYAYALGSDGTGGVIVAGRSDSTDLPVTRGALDRTGEKWGEAFLARIGPNGRALRYATYLGGSGWDGARALALAPGGDVALAGFTVAWNFPTTAGAFQRKPSGRVDGFAALLRAMPAGTDRFGRATAGCEGLPRIDVSRFPAAGQASFGLTCGHAPVRGAGVLLLGAGRLTAGMRVLGTELWLDPLLLAAVAPVAATSLGGSEVRLPLPAGSGGVRFYGQFFWLDRCAPGGLSASAGVSVRVQ